MQWGLAAIRRILLTRYARALICSTVLLQPALHATERCMLATSKGKRQKNGLLCRRFQKPVCRLATHDGRVIHHRFKKDATVGRACRDFPARISITCTKRKNCCTIGL